MLETHLQGFTDTATILEAFFRAYDDGVSAYLFGIICNAVSLTPGLGGYHYS